MAFGFRKWQHTPAKDLMESKSPSRTYSGWGVRNNGVLSRETVVTLYGKGSCCMWQQMSDMVCLDDWASSWIFDINTYLIDCTCTAVTGRKSVEYSLPSPVGLKFTV